MAHFGRWMRFAVVGWIGCADGDAGTDGDTDGYEPSWPTLTCDPIVAYCGFPFPSNVFTQADEGTPTGRRVALDVQTMPRVNAGPGTDPSVFNRADGFSGSPIMAHFPGATEAGLASSSNVAASLASDALTLVLDAERGEPVMHWAELDRLAAGGDDDRTFLIQPAVRLRDSTRYIVAVRGLTDASGEVLPPTPAFAALREGAEFGDRAVDERVELYEDIFARLEAQGWERSEVQLAWDFTTRSKEDVTGWLRHMRDDALAIVGDSGPEYTITSVDEDFDPEHIAFRIQGTFEAPLYLSQVDPPAWLNFGADDLPTVNPSTPTVTVGFDLMIPHSAVDEGPKPLVMYGHGQFGRADQIGSGTFRSFMNEFGYVFFGIDLMGMASEDGEWLQGPLTTPLLQARMHDVTAFHDRLHQGMINHVLALRMMKARFAQDDDYGDYIDGETAYYYGISQGGIMGVVHSALSADVERAALGVMGQPYSLLLPRSRNFTPFFDILKVALADGRDVHLALGLTQQTWTRVEPDGWSAYVIGNTVDEQTPPKQVFLRMAEADQQVTTLGADIMARTLGAVQIEAGGREIPGLDVVSETDGPAAVISYDLGHPTIPDCNLPMLACRDPHGPLRSLDAARAQLDHFFRTGEVRSFCSGACRFPEMADCDEGEDQAAVDATCEL